MTWCVAMVMEKVKKEKTLNPEVEDSVAELESFMGESQTTDKSNRWAWPWKVAREKQEGRFVCSKQMVWCWSFQGVQFTLFSAKNSFSCFLRQNAPPLSVQAAASDRPAVIASLIQPFRTPVRAACLCGSTVTLQRDIFCICQPKTHSIVFCTKTCVWYRAHVFGCGGETCWSES